MIHNSKILFASIIFLSLTQSCKKFIAVEPSTSSINAADVFEDYTTATAAVTDIYAKLREQGIVTGSLVGLPLQLGNYTDETDTYENITNSSVAGVFYQNRLLATTSFIQELWNDSYNKIYAANAVIEGLEKSKKLSTQNKKQLQGEALFIRAFVHFYLVNLYGNIPYITETDFRNNRTVSRIDTQKVYENIILDLKNAALLLPATYLGTNRVRPNSLTCNALLARAYLYNKQYTEAANEATTVLNQTPLYILEPDPNNVFLIKSKETIWQLQSANAGQNTYEAAMYMFSVGPPTVAALTDNLVSSFSANDQRKLKWTRAVDNEAGTETWYHPFKYKEQNNTGTSLEYSIMFRLAEQYLIRAEARAQTGDLEGAKDDLNEIRTRAGLPATTAQSKDEIISAILQERRWEFFTELGHRFYDLKRLGALDAVLSPVKPGWDTNDKLFPIPQGDLNLNPNLLPQNPGYF